jgi:hypothetical protein
MTYAHGRKRERARQRFCEGMKASNGGVARVCPVCPNFVTTLRPRDPASTIERTVSGAAEHLGRLNNRQRDDVGLCQCQARNGVISLKQMRIDLNANAARRIFH